MAKPRVLRGLQAAPQLQALLVRGFDMPPRQPLPAPLQFVSWAAAQPQLRELTVALSHEGAGPDGAAAAAGSRGADGTAQKRDRDREQAARAAEAALVRAAMEAQQRRPGLAVRIVGEDELMDPDSLFLDPVEQWE